MGGRTWNTCSGLDRLRDREWDRGGADRRLTGRGAEDGIEVGREWDYPYRQMRQFVPWLMIGKIQKASRYVLSKQEGTE